MKWGRVLMPLLALASSCVCLAQNNRPDPIVRQSAQDLREGRLTDAQKLLTDAVHELEQSDPESPRLADYLQRLAGVLNRLGRGEESAALVERAYEIDRKAYGPMDLRITHDLVSQAMSAHAAGDTGKAERLFNQALEVVRANAALVDQHPGMGEGVVGPVVDFYIKEHRWIEADSLLPELTRLCGMIEEPYRTGYEPCGRLPEVVTEIRNAEGTTADVGGLPYTGNLPRELEALNESAKKFGADGLYPSAEDTYNRAIAVAEKIDADPRNLYDGLDVGEIILLGQLFEKEGLKDRAEQTYSRALQIQEKIAGPEPGHTSSAAALAPYFLVTLYRGEGRLTDAELLLKKVIEIQVRSLGERNRQVVQNILMLAGVDEEEGKADEIKYTKAVPLYEQALAIQEANLGPNHWQLLDVLRPYAELLDKMHDSTKAAEVRARMVRISSAQQNAPK